MATQIKNILKKKKIAVFDIDGTIFRSSLLIELLEGLIMEKVFPTRARKIYEKEYQNWLNRKGSYEDYLYRVIKTYRKFIKGVKEERVWEIGKKIMAFHKNRTYRFSRDLILKLRKNYYLLAISTSPRVILKPFCDEWGFTKTYGSIYTVDESGQFTGQILYEESIRDKEKILMRAVKKENLNLKGSIGVGDTESDILFLKLVEHPIAFNPNKELYQYAAKKKWPIIVERKDVIYSIRKDDISSKARYKISVKNLPPEIKNILKK